MHICHLVLPIFFRNVKTDIQKHEMTCPGHLVDMWLKLELRCSGLSPDTWLPSHWVRIRGYTSASGFPEPLVLSSLGQSPGTHHPHPCWPLCVHTHARTCRGSGISTNGSDRRERRLPLTCLALHRAAFLPMKPSRTNPSLLVLFYRSTCTTRGTNPPSAAITYQGL